MAAVGAFADQQRPAPVQPARQVQGHRKGAGLIEQSVGLELIRQGAGQGVEKGHIAEFLPAATARGRGAPHQLEAPSPPGEAPRRDLPGAATPRPHLHRGPAAPPEPPGRPAGRASRHSRSPRRAGWGSRRRRPPPPDRAPAAPGASDRELGRAQRRGPDSSCTRGWCSSRSSSRAISGRCSPIQPTAAAGLPPALAQILRRERHRADHSRRRSDADGGRG